MAVQESTVPVDDSGMLADLMSDAPAPEVRAEPEQAQPETVERPRDEQGRFAPKEPAVEAKAPEVAVEAEPKDEAAQVPSWRLRELREAREAAERKAEEATRQNYAFQEQMRSLQKRLDEISKPKQEPVDFFQNPDGALDQRIQPLRSEIDQFKSELRLEMSRELAVVKYGDEKVAEMERAVEQAMRENSPDMQSLSIRMRNSNNPAAVAMQWYQQHTLVKETGGDLSKYKERLTDELLKDPAFQAKVLEAARGQAQAAPGQRPNIQLPPSLNRVTGSGNSPDADAGDMSDGSLFRQAMSAPRR